MAAQRPLFLYQNDERDEYLFEADASVLESVVVVLHVLVVVVGVDEVLSRAGKDVV